MTDKRWETWRGAFKIAIRVMEDSEPLETPKIVCTGCGQFLAYLADDDRVASLMTLAAEHTCYERFDPTAPAWTPDGSPAYEGDLDA